MLGNIIRYSLSHNIAMNQSVNQLRAGVGESALNATDTQSHHPCRWFILILINYDEVTAS